jgi:excisionase family DNA binding protein
MVRGKMSATESQLLFTVKEVAAILQIGRTTVYELIYAGTLASVKIGACRRIRRIDLETYVQGLTGIC